MSFAYSVLAVMMCIVAMPVSAHWQWLDKEGNKVFSDRPPGHDIPEKNILQRSALTPAAVLPQAPTSLARPTSVDKVLMQKKKQLQELENAKRRLDEDKAGKARAENCQRAKAARASMASGRVIAVPNEQGQPQILDAQARAAELTRLEEIIESNCNP